MSPPLLVLGSFIAAAALVYSALFWCLALEENQRWDEYAPAVLWYYPSDWIIPCTALLWFVWRVFQ